MGNVASSTPRSNITGAVHCRREDSSSSRTVDSDAPSQVSLLSKSSVDIHNHASVSSPILITTKQISYDTTKRSPFSDSYISYPDPSSFASSSTAPSHHLLKEPAKTLEEGRGSRKRATSMASNMSVSTMSSATSKSDIYGTLVRPFERKKRVDGRVWVVGKDIEDEGVTIRVGYPYYEEVAVMTQLEDTKMKSLRRLRWR